MPDPEKYTVGWVCAIDTEFVAARAFLDVEHDTSELVVATNDNNSYALGMISHHNVVIAVLPDGQYGTTSAATVARSMMLSFTNVRIGLMVGIGGGAPSSRRDIRLGDVVVNRTAGGLGGVLQYDYGATIQAQEFKNTSFLNQSPEVLRTSVAALRATYELKGHQLEKSVEGALGNIKKRSKYKRPSPESDRLYQKDVVHRAEKSGGISRTYGVNNGPGCDVTCGTDASLLVQRPNRDEEDDNPAIHYGLIASGNTLVKDANMRDRLADEQDVLCFEMEAAGLMNHFPCLIVRGICDYCDSHKNKEWQGFAAMMAAAYAKDLLQQIPRNKVEAENKIIDALSNIQREVQRTSQTSLDIRSTQNMDQIRHWLSPSDPSTNANHARNLRHEGTGEWLLSNSVFRSWQEGSRRHVWLHGLAGCGKTVLCSKVLDCLAADENRCLLSFFFDFNDIEKQTLEGLLRSLAWQLYHGQVGVAVLESAFRRHRQGQQQPTIMSLQAMISSMLQCHKKISLIIDALDESTDREEQLLPWIDHLVNGPDTSHVQLFCTGRPQPEFEQRLVPLIGSGNILTIDENGIAADIESYVARRLLEPSFQWETMPPSLLQEIKNEIGHRSKGMFRWAACQMDSLAQCDSPNATKATLKNLPNTLAKTYQRMIESIPDRRKVASLRLLQFLVHSKRPLLVSEAIDVIATNSEVESPCFDPNNRLYDNSMLLAYCPCLVSIVTGPGRRGSQPELHLAHFSVKEYLLGQVGLAPKAASVTIVKTCLVYLRKIQDEVPSVKDRYPLSAFAAEFWPGFATLAEPNDEVLRLGWDFVQAEHTFLRWAELYEWKEPYYSYTEETACNWPVGTRLYYASRGGLIRIVERLLESDSDINFVCGDYGSALQAAIAEGHCEMVKMLLDRGAQFDRMSGGIGPPLLLASQKGHESIVKLLLEKGADVDATGEDNGTPLQAASTNGHTDIVRMLLEQNANVNVLGGYYQTALFAALLNNNDAIAEMLMDKGADVNARTARYGVDTVLYLVCMKKPLEIVMKVLENGANVNARSDHGGTALIAASGRRSKEIVKLLLDKGADVNAVGRTHKRIRDIRSQRGELSTALIVASHCGDGESVILLLDGGADVNFRVPSFGCRFDTALTAASWTGHQNIVDILLDRGADIHAQGTHFGTALWGASKHGHEETVKLLLNRGADVNAQNKTCGSALLAASREGHSHIVAMLLDKGADVHAQNGSCGSASLAASKEGHAEVLNLLLKAGADVNAQSETCDYALLAASREGHSHIVAILLEKGADTDVRCEERDPALVEATWKGHTEVVNLLLSGGADVNIQSDTHGSALLAASERRYFHLAKLLLDSGANVNARGGYWASSPLERASSKGYDDIVQMLLDWGADVNGKHGRRGTALEAASFNGHHAIVDMLLGNGADINLQGSKTFGNALIAATRGGQTASVRKLLDLHVDVNAQGGQRGNALLEALDRGHVEIAKLLLDGGADFTVRGSWFHSNALQAAAYHGHLEIVDILLRKGADVNEQGGDMRNALHAASARGHREIVQLLVAKGADITTSWYTRSQSHNTHSESQDSQPESQEDTQSSRGNTP